MADGQGKVSISQLLYDLANKKIIRLVGWDQIGGANDTISVSQDMSAFLSSLKSVKPSADEKGNARALSKLGQLVAESTDYDCIIGPDYFVVTPKENIKLHNTPVSKRMIEVPAATNLSLNWLLGQLRTSSNDNNGPILLSVPDFMVSSLITKGNISTKASSAPCYEVLNNIARQLKARSWVIENFIGGGNDDKASNSGKPMQLGNAQIAFYSVH
jgi:hypothetical protein